MNPFIEFFITLGLISGSAQALPPQYGSPEEITKLQREYTEWQERYNRGLWKADLRKERQNADAAKNQCQKEVDGLVRNIAVQERTYQNLMTRINNLKEEAERVRLGKQVLTEDLATQRRALQRCEDQSKDLKQRSPKEKSAAKMNEIRGRLARFGIHVA